jgi:hypothetical protein
VWLNALRAFGAASALICLCVLPAGGRTQAASVHAPILFVSANGSDAGACAHAHPCNSFDRAYHVAKPGDLVQVAPGSYGAQTLSTDASKTSGKDVVIAAAPGADVVVTDQVDIRAAAHVELRGMHLRGGWHVYEGSQDVTFRDDETAYFFVDSSSDVRIIGGSVGPDVDLDNGQIRPSRDGAPAPRNILIDGTYFHDATQSLGSDAHVECLQVAEVDGLTIRNSRFDNCETHYVFISPFWGGAEQKILLENNMGGSVRSGFYGFRVAADACGDIRFRYNSALSTTLIVCSRIVGPVRLVANIGPYQGFACNPHFQYSHNVWVNAKCGPTDVEAPSGFRDPARFDLRLARGAAALGRGDPADYPVVDIEGKRRPTRYRPDAGADQREPVDIVLGKSIGAAAIGMTRSQVEDFYGATHVRSRRVATARRALPVASYRVHGGRLWVAYSDGRVAGIGTTSSYYSTKDGLVRQGATRTGRGWHWSTCRRAYSRVVRGVNVNVSPLAGKKNAPIGSVSMLKNELAAAC